MTMILTGMVVTSMFNAGVSLTKSFAGASDAQLSEITFWLMGSMTHLTFNLLPTLVIPVTIGIIPIILLRYRLNVLSFGEEEAEIKKLCKCEVTKMLGDNTYMTKK